MSPQIPSNVEVDDGFAMEYHIALFFDLEKVVVPRNESFEKILERLNDMKILLENEISDPLAIMYTHGGKQ